MLHVTFSATSAPAPLPASTAARRVASVRFAGDTPPPPNPSPPPNDGSWWNTLKTMGRAVWRTVNRLFLQPLLGLWRALVSHITGQPVAPKDNPAPAPPPPPSPPPPDPKAILLERLFGPDLTKITFRQRDVGDCYLLAAFDAIFHHPEGHMLLSQFDIEEIKTTDGTVEKYKVTFPNGRSQEFEARELGTRKNGKLPVDGPLGLQILEMAYAKMVRAERNAGRYPNGGAGQTMILVEADEPKLALERMFGGGKVDHKARYNVPPGTVIKETDPLAANPNGLQDLESRLRSMDADPDNLYVLTAYTPGLLPKGTPNREFIGVDIPGRGFTWFHRGHAYSVRHFDVQNRTITLANPHDTEKQLYTLTFEQFGQVFRAISGIRLPKP